MAVGTEGELLVQAMRPLCKVEAELPSQRLVLEGYTGIIGDKGGSVSTGVAAPFGL